MRIEPIENAQATWGIAAIPDTDDSRPMIARCNIDAYPQRLSADRLAIGSYLLFGRHAGSAFSTPGAVSVRVRDAIREALRMRPSASEAQFNAREGSSRIVELTDSIGGVLDTTRCALAVLRSDRWHGAIRSHRSIITGSNAFLLAQSDTDIRPLLGVAVLLASDLGIDAISISEATPNADDVRRYDALLASCGLALV